MKTPRLKLPCAPVLLQQLQHARIALCAFVMKHERDADSDDGQYASRNRARRFDGTPAPTNRALWTDADIEMLRSLWQTLAKKHEQIALQIPGKNAAQIKA
jgi:hypothetical protein